MCPFSCLWYKNMMLSLALPTLAIIAVLTTTTRLAEGISTNDTDTAVEVTRRLQDTYNLFHGVSQVCNEDANFTYLVQENQCISNQDLFNSKYES